MSGEQNEVATPAEAVERKKRKRRVDETAFELGRVLGVLARRDPELFEKISEIAEESGTNVTDLVYEALRIYYDYVTLSKVDTMCLISSLHLIDTLMRRVVQMMNVVSQLFTSEFFHQQIELLQQLQQQREQLLAAMKEEERKEEVKRVTAPLREQLMSTVTTALMNMISAMLTNMVSAMTGQRVQLPQATPAPTTQLVATAQKPKIVKSAEEGSN